MKESYESLFQRLEEKNEGAFIPFIVAGDPDFETSLEIVQTFLDNGADALEIGFPFSDPVADGITVQNADIRALNSGMNTDKCFDFIRRVRELTSAPIGVLVYYNLIYKRGVDDFYREAAECGVNGILAADLPPEEAGMVLQASKKYGVDQIFMAAQTTSNERLAHILEVCSGFLYVVAVMGVTGARKEIQPDTIRLIQRLKSHSNLPLAVGFGLSQPKQVEHVIKAGSNGAIVASAILDIISRNLNDKVTLKREVARFCSELKAATRK